MDLKLSPLFGPGNRFRELFSHPIEKSEDVAADVAAGTRERVIASIVNTDGRDPITLNSPNGRAYAFSRDGKQVCGYIHDNKYNIPTIWNFITGKQTELKGYGAAFAFSRDGKQVCGYTLDNKDFPIPTVWDVKTRKLTKLKGVYGYADAFSRDGKKVCGRTYINRVLTPAIWNVKNRSLRTLDGNGQALAFNPDGTKVCGYTGISVPVPAIWNVATGKLTNLIGETGVASAFSSDGTKVCGYRNNNGLELTIWDITGINSPITLSKNRGNTLAFSQDGTKVCGYTKDDDYINTPAIWNDTNNTSSPITFTGNGVVKAFSLDGNKVYITNDN